MLKIWILSTSNLGSPLVYTMSMSFRCIYVRHQHNTTFNENGQDLFMIFETPNQSIKNLNMCMKSGTKKQTCKLYINIGINHYHHT